MLGMLLAVHTTTQCYEILYIENSVYFEYVSQFS
jgi:hypothetical protein